LLSEGLGANTKTGEQRKHYSIGLRHQRGKQVHRLYLLILVLRSHFLGALDGFLRLHGHFFKSQHRTPQNLNSDVSFAERGWRVGQPLFLQLTYFAYSLFAASPYLPEAAAATAGAFTFTLTCFGFASSRLGIVSVSTPF